MFQKLMNIWHTSTLKTKVGFILGTGFYGLGMLYVAVHRLLIAGHNNDPIYKIFGIDLRDQFFLINLIMLIVFSCWSGLAIRQRGLLRPVDKSSSSCPLTIIFALIFANAAASSAGGVIADMSERFLLPVYVWVLIILIVQLAFVRLALPRIRSVALQLLILVSLSVLAIYALNFCLAAWFRTEGLVLQILALTVTSLMVTSLFLLVLARHTIWKNVALILTLTFFAPLINISLQYATDDVETPGPLGRFADLKLSSKPDIHIVSLDALAPPELAAKYLDLDEVPYAIALTDKNVKRFPNAFATNVPTKWSINSVMRLAQSDFPPYFDYFSGQRASPLSALLHSNGYVIENGFPGTYLGYKGEHIDSYRPDPSWAIRNSAICILADASPMAFFGLCEVGVLLDKERIAKPWEDQVVDLLQAYLTREDGPPMFTYHHILDPIGHTPLNYRTDSLEAQTAFRGIFLSKAKRASTLIRKISRLAQKNKRHTVIILIGDHGLWVSRTVKFEENRTFFVQDRHGIVLATLVDQSGCSPSELKYFMQNHATPERLLAGLFRCLTTDPLSFERALSFSEPFNFGKYPYSDPE